MSNSKYLNIFQMVRDSLPITIDIFTKKTFTLIVFIPFLKSHFSTQILMPLNDISLTYSYQKLSLI